MEDTQHSVGLNSLMTDQSGKEVIITLGYEDSNGCPMKLMASFLHIWPLFCHNWEIFNKVTIFGSVG